MQTLTAELTRLYFGADSQAGKLVDAAGMARAAVIPFRKAAEPHWQRLCEVANALQGDLGWPAPAVSISGSDGFGLWLSFQTAMPAAQMHGLLVLLQKKYFPEIALGPDAVASPVEVPPRQHPQTGRWAAFINPGLGASFADESGLEMAPPEAGQVALLEGLQSISDTQVRDALAVLGEPVQTAAPAAPPQGLLLRDATLEDIVRHLHAKNIEPTFRHLLRP